MYLVFIIMECCWSYFKKLLFLLSGFFLELRKSSGLLDFVFIEGNMNGMNYGLIS